MGLLELLLMGLPLGGVGYFGWLALRYVRARERDIPAREQTIPDSRLASLQETVASLQSEVHALRERQEFVEKLLERPRPPSSLTP